MKIKEEAGARVSLNDEGIPEVALSSPHCARLLMAIKGGVNKKKTLEPAYLIAGSKACSTLEVRGLWKRAPNVCPMCGPHSACWRGSLLATLSKGVISYNS